VALTNAALSDGFATNIAPVQRRAGTPLRDLQRTFRLTLATVWLFDAVLQLQPFMFTRGSAGFSGMLHGVAAGNPGWIAHTITWNASIVEQQPVLTNALFASVQFLIGFGIVYRRTCKPALVLSIAWSLAVWWFGEGLGAVFSGGATPLGGGPGGVLFYGLLAAGSFRHPFPDEPEVAPGLRAPETTRAALRGGCIEKFGPLVESAQWDAVVLKTAGAGRIGKADTHNRLVQRLSVIAVASKVIRA